MTAEVESSVFDRCGGRRAGALAVDRAERTFHAELKPISDVHDPAQATHNALDDAIEQGELFRNLMRRQAQE
ncbi:hypothetical protein [Streptomyces erythrochromogenes]|uniref:hypothetical protein n=1 Tax=Streptomyces erythrochromogenes TaxID=285574 RepID=UPI0038063EBD